MTTPLKVKREQAVLRGALDKVRDLLLGRRNPVEVAWWINNNHREYVDALDARARADIRGMSDVAEKQID